MKADSVECLSHWIAKLQPFRTAVVTHQPSPLEQGLFERLLERSQKDLEWAPQVPQRWRPCVQIQSPPSLEPDPQLLEEPESLDLAICLEALSELPPGAGNELLGNLRRKARFVIAALPMDKNSVGWKTRDWQTLCPLLTKRDGNYLFVLLRGGIPLTDPYFQGPKIWYIAPNRQIYGGVKILYNHVSILNRLGIPALIGTRQRINWPAQWFAWNPTYLAFSGNAVANISEQDTVVIPEFQHRHIRKYMHAKRRLLFAQGPGFCKEIHKWHRMGYDGVLTLNIPDGRRSQLHEFLLENNCPLPIYPISNHYSDDHWGKVTAERIPGRILCLPRKGKHFVDRLEREFTGIHRVDNMHQVRMGLEYAAADIYVHTGFPEGQPMPPIEAMLSGCVVCGFPGRGGKDVMIEGKTGYLAEDGDYDQLAAALRRAINDPNREQVRQAGWRLASMFTREATANELQECYRQWVPALPAPSVSLLAKLRDRFYLRSRNSGLATTSHQ